MKFDDDFKKRMLICRSRVGLTQNELAGLIGVAQRMIAAYELGESRPRLKVLMKLAEAFGVSPDWLAGGLDSGNYREHVTNVDSRRVPILKPGLVYQYIDNSLDDAFIKEHITIGFEVGISAFAIRIEDDSMTSSEANEYSFPRGTIVILDPSIPVRGGDYVLVHLHNAPPPRTVFRKYSPSLESITLTPLNKNYPVDSFSNISLREISVSVIPAVGIISTLPALARLKPMRDIISENEEPHQTSTIAKPKEESDKKPT